jgi:hypothetical protein
VPYIEVRNPSAQIEHEATTSKISDDQLFYAMQRGLGQEEAVALIVNGFAREVLQQLPMEFAVEAQKLLGISLRGAWGEHRRATLLVIQQSAAPAASATMSATVYTDCVRDTALKSRKDRTANVVVEAAMLKCRAILSSTSTTRREIPSGVPASEEHDRETLESLARKKHSFESLKHGPTMLPSRNIHTTTNRHPALDAVSRFSSGARAGRQRGPPRVRGDELGKMGCLG